MDQAWLGRLEHDLSRLVDERRTPGAAFAIRLGDEESVRCVGVTALEGGVPVTPDTPFWLASVSKPIGAVLAHVLLEDGAMSLDDPLERWLPELVSPRVLVHPSAALQDTVPAARPPTVHDLLAGTLGWGMAADCFADPPPPLFSAMIEMGVSPGPFAADLDPDDFIARLAALPLASQPGEEWRYHVPHDVLSVLLARVAGRPLPELLDDRLLQPLGLQHTGFGDPSRTAAEVTDIHSRHSSGEVDVVPAPDPRRPPAFPGLGAGLLSSAADLLSLGSTLLDGGGPVLSRAQLTVMTSDALTGEQRAAAAPFIEPGSSWGLGVGIDVPLDQGVAPEQVWHSPGRFGWIGGTGTMFYVDPAHDLVAVLLTGRLMNGPDDAPDSFVDTLVAGLVS
ncbi:serine hydrolase domain-containing protein [Aeromicrobium sp. CF3.5]|uniref:serine hydrolase domain-containing protein n=1 Tax=Aeromicrobium sp. CF3.5 TaxID=3373078 RepID=UPI003EE7AA09